MSEPRANLENENGVYYMVVTPMGNLKAFYGNEDEDGDYPQVVWTGDSEAIKYLEYLSFFNHLHWQDCGGNIQRFAPHSVEAMHGVMGVFVLPCEALLRQRAREQAEKEAFDGLKIDITEQEQPSRNRCD